MSWFDSYVEEPVWTKELFKEKIEKMKKNIGEKNFKKKVDSAQDSLVSAATGILNFNSQKNKRSLRGEKEKMGVLNIVQKYLAQQEMELVTIWKQDIAMMREQQYK